jgi:dTDP-glucose pyrophosphorylase
MSVGEEKPKQSKINVCSSNTGLYDNKVVEYAKKSKPQKEVKKKYSLNQIYLIEKVS